MSRTVTFLRRVLAEKRVVVALVALGLAADAGLYTLAVYPASVEVEDAGRRAAAAAANLEAARRRFESARLAADAMTRRTRNCARSTRRSCRAIWPARAHSRSPDLPRSRPTTGC